MRIPGLFLTAAVLALAGAAQAAPQNVSFVTCPIFRDAVVQCWLAEHKGKTYYIGRTGLGKPPELRHKVLVEGVVAEGHTSCGGIVIEPLRVAVLPEVDFNCDTVLPDNGDRPSEPGIGELPQEIQLMIGAPAPDPLPPFTDRTYTIDFNYGSTVMSQQSQADVETAWRYAKVGKAATVEVIGFASDARLDSGEILKEPDSLAADRAKIVAHALSELGLPGPKVTVRWEKAKPGDGVNDAASRKVQVIVRFKPARPS